MQLSGGQLQRAAIARAIAPRRGRRPHIVIADEPTSALDAALRRTIVDLLRELQREHGFTLIFVTHDFGLVQQLAAHTVVMRGGRIVESGPTAEVLAEPSDAYTADLLRAVPSLPDLARDLA